MSEETSHDERNQQQNKPERNLALAPVDWLLESIVAEANHVEQYAVPVTLLTRGGAVTGTLISMREYFTLLGDWWVDATRSNSPEYGAYMKESLTKAGEDANAELKQNDEHEFNYLHLKHVRHLAGLSLPEPGVLWRGRLGEVVGFAFGSFVSAPVMLTATAHLKRNAQ